MGSASGCITWLEANGINVNTGDYPAAKKTLAVELALLDAKRETRTGFTTAEMSITADQYKLTLPSGFEPWMFETARIGTNVQLSLLDFETLMEDIDGGGTGEPIAIALRADEGIIAPISNDAYTLKFKYLTPGVDYDMPDDIIKVACMYLAPAHLQFNDPDMRYTSWAWQRGIEILKKMRIARGRTAKVRRWFDI